MNRGDLVGIAVQGDFGKPRPALIVQSDQFGEHTSVTVLLVSSTLVDAPLMRVTVQPKPENGLQKPAQVMVDKAMTVRRDKLGESFGNLNTQEMTQIERCLAVFLGVVIAI